MRNLKNLNRKQSIESKKLIFEESWFDKIDTIVNFVFFGSGGVVPLLSYFDPNFKGKGIEYFFLLSFSIFCLYSFYKKATEKKFHIIKSQFDEKTNQKIINEYCLENGFEKRKNSNGIIIFNSENTLNIYPNHVTSRIFILSNNEIYFTMLKENFKLNIPVLFSDYITLYQLRKKLKNFGSS